MIREAYVAKMMKDYAALIWARCLTPDRRRRKRQHIKCTVYDHPARSFASRKIHGEKVMRTDFVIELRIDIDPDDGETKQVLIEAVRTAAQMIYTQATLVANRRQPSLGITYDGGYEGKEDILLFQPDEETPTE